MDLTVLWFILIAVLWTGYLVVEGFDFGVGMLIPILPKGDTSAQEKERRVMINSIGPVWDGNQVWLLTAGGATFAAFPEWYATLFSGFYLPLLLILVALILRGVAFEYRGKIADPTWARGFEWFIVVGSWLPSILWGVAFANLVRGVAMDGAYQYTGGFFALLNPFSLLGGLCLTGLFLLQGMLYLRLKTTGELRDRVTTMLGTWSLVATVIAAVWAVWAQLAYSRNAWTWAAVVVAALCLIGVVLTTRMGKEGLAFILNSAALAAAVTLIFGAMYPYAMPPLADGPGLTLDYASSSELTLTIMTWVAVILVPVVLGYTSWSYWTFRRRIGIDSIPAPAGLSYKLDKVANAAFGSGRGPAGLDLTLAESTSSTEGSSHG